MPKARLYFDGDDGIQKDSRIYKLRDDIAQKIENVPTVIDNTSSSSRTDALSANMGRDLQEQINNLAARGRYLSTRNAVTGLPDTQPQTNPYVYRAGDYYIVSNIGVTNYRPQGASYTIGVSSTAEEHAAVNVNDLYIYDGTQWVLQGSTSTSVSWGSIVGNIANQGDLQNALDDKQDELTAGEGINIDANNVISNTLPGAMVNATAPSNPSQGDLWYDTTNNKLKTFDGTQWNETGVTYAAGDNIQINGTTISATDTKYSAGRNITIGGNVINARDTEYTAGSNITITCPIESDMKGPAPSGFHVPLKSEWEAICNIIGNVLGLSVGKATFETYLLMPTAGIRFYNLYFSDFYFGYWTSTRADDGKARFLDEHRVTTGGYPQVSNAYAIRTFKNTPVVPDNNWATLYDGSSVAANAGIFYSSTDGLISISGDGTTWYTIQDKNLGATVVYHSGDALSDANCGALYQWGNNYGFSRSNTPSKQNPTAISASGYGPGNYYTSDIYGTARPTRDNSGNKNLRGGQTQGTWQDCEHPIISAIGGTTYTAGNGINIDQNDEISIDATVVATQTDLASKQDTLTAGENIQIDTTTNTISATDTTYNAGENITIEDVCTTESDMKGPAPSGFHVPLNTEWQAVYNIWTALGGGSSDGINFGIALKLPFAGNRNYSSAGVNNQGTYGGYWSSSRYNARHSYSLRFNSTALYPQDYNNRAYGFPVRCFKDTPTIPTSSWTKLYGTSIEAGGIFWSSTEGLISMSSDGQTWITIADKNLGATTVWNSGDTLSEANCGYYYQRGNNYGFPRTGTIANQSTTQVDASNYGPGNYYSSDTFIKNSGSWDSTDNGNLWGGVSQGTHQECIHNVISAADTTYTTGNGIDITNNEISVDNTIARVTDVNTKTFYLSSTSDLTTAQAVLDWYKSGNNPIVSYNDEMYYFKEYEDAYYKKLWFYKDSLDVLELGNYTMINRPKLGFDLDNEGTTVTGIRDYNFDTIANLLDTSTDYSSPYTPQYNGSPATKKYVDDSISAITIPTYTAGSGINIDSNNEISADTTVLATKADIANLGTFVVVDSLPTVSQADENKIYVLDLGDDKYEEWIIKDVEPGFVSDSPITKVSFNETIAGGNDYTWTGPGNIYMGFNNLSVTGDSYDVQVYDNFETYPDTIDLAQQTMPYIYEANSMHEGRVIQLCRSPYVYVPNNGSSDVTFSMDLWYSSSPVTWDAGGKVWAKVTDPVTEAYVNSLGFKVFSGNTLAAIGADIASWLTLMGDQGTDATFHPFAVSWNNMIWIRRNTYSDNEGNRRLYVQGIAPSATNYNNGTSLLKFNLMVIDFSYSNGTWTYVNASDTWQTSHDGRYIRADYNYSNPYTPLYNGSPTTKKYVDDNDTYIGTSAPTNNLVEGRLWYDTTNDILKVYDGTNWHTVDTDANTTYSAGNGISIDANNEISVDTSVVAEVSDVNVKAFYMNYVSETSIAQDAYDWYRNGGTPLLCYGGTEPYVLYDVEEMVPGDGTMTFRRSRGLSYSSVTFTYSDYTVTNVTTAGGSYGNLGIQNDTTGTTSTVAKIWAGTQAEYDLLSSYDTTTIYYIV